VILDDLTIGSDLRGPKTKNQKEKAPHKMHRKTARRKDRTWRVTNDGLVANLVANHNAPQLGR